MRAKLELQENHCKGCELCVQACPRDVLAMGSNINALGYRPASIVDPEKCTGCKACALVCPEVCFTIWQVA
ncbi:MAG TPA: 4Fe-4S binding protein [Symbiobacteriaceae bacterium]|jgi:2-oxoglutarate ferredoxin oxidoreductase subunit delta|nr:putative ferredoxin [Symbiobacteriaceae bacterium]HYF78948.1 4Fe-4S binding protein [Symbiobacteriaceae bacterium]